MGKKKKNKQEDNLPPFCYYCDRIFDNESDLIIHQKNKHFKCPECNKKMNTAQGLATHCYQVHKLSVTTVPGAKTGRDSVDVEIFGMAGVPEGVLPAKLQAEAQALKKARTDDPSPTPPFFGAGPLSAPSYQPPLGVYGTPPMPYNGYRPMPPMQGGVPPQALPSMGPPPYDHSGQPRPPQHPPMQHPPPGHLGGGGLYGGPQMFGLAPNSGGYPHHLHHPGAPPLHQGMPPPPHGPIPPPGGPAPPLLSGMPPGVRPGTAPPIRPPGAFPLPYPGAPRGMYLPPVHGGMSLPQAGVPPPVPPPGAIQSGMGLGMLPSGAMSLSGVFLPGGPGGAPHGFGLDGSGILPPTRPPMQPLFPVVGSLGSSETATAGAGVDGSSAPSSSTPPLPYGMSGTSLYGGLAGPQLSAGTPPGTSASATAPVAVAPPAAESSALVLWTDEAFSMEERRAMLPKYATAVGPVAAAAAAGAVEFTTS